MGKITYITAGESHGPALTAVIKGFPAGFFIDVNAVNSQLARRQQGYGRGGRMKIESDKVDILSGCRNSMLLGSPVSCIIHNKDFKNWEAQMHPVAAAEMEPIHVPRPGHADYAGAIKYNFKDIRNVLERASARETAARIIPGAMARQMLEDLGIRIYSHVLQIGKAQVLQKDLPSEEQLKASDDSDVRCLDTKKSEEMRQEIDTAKSRGDSLGGIFQVVVLGLPVGLGSYVHWDTKLQSQIAAEILGIQAMKGIEFGLGFSGAAVPGSEYHDEFCIKNDVITRKSNRAGGLEGGMSNGNPLLFNVVMKPIPTLTRPLDSVDLQTGKKVQAHKERTDSCAVPAAAVVAENVTAVPLMNALMERFGSDNWDMIKTGFLNG